MTIPVNQMCTPKLFLYPYVEQGQKPCSACKVRIQTLQHRTDEVTKGTSRWASPAIVKEDAKVLFDKMAQAATPHSTHSLQNQLWSLQNEDLESSGVSFARSMHNSSMEARRLITLYDRWGTVRRPAEEELRQPREALISRLPASHIRLRY